MRPKIISLAIAAATLCMGFAPHSANAAVTTLVATAGDRSAHSFTTPVVVTPQGGPLQFVNWDVQGYQVYSIETRPDGSAPWCAKFAAGTCPLLRSDYAEAGGTTVPIGGIADAASGNYTLYDAYDHTVTATLVVL